MFVIISNSYEQENRVLFNPRYTCFCIPVGQLGNSLEYTHNILFHCNIMNSAFHILQKELCAFSKYFDLYVVH